MRVLHLAILLLVLAVVGLTVMAYLDMAPVPALNEIAWGIKGYGAAKTPEEAIEKYNKAMEKRNYHAAARYLDDEYQRKFRDTAKRAGKLAVAVDNFRHTAKDRGIDAEKVEWLLVSVDPFPKNIKVTTQPVIKDDTAYVIVDEEYSSRLHPGIKGRGINLKKSNDAWRLVVGLDEPMYTYALVRETVVPVQTTRRKHLDDISKYGQDLTNALDVVKNRMKTDATTKENVFNDLIEELRTATKPE